jgi:formylglycine-generating enzyme required for sulfatase activity
VERIWDRGLSRFEVGDRIIEVRGQEVHTQGDLASALKGVQEDEEVTAAAVRGGSRVELPWIPFPAAVLDRIRKALPGFQAGRVASHRVQFGFTLEGTPLEFREENLLGTTGADGAPGCELPRGSYLFVFQKDGFADARYPVTIPREGGEGAGASGDLIRVILLQPHEIPPGFVYVPAGPVRTGGDPDAWQSWPRGAFTVSGFFMARYEVTLGEWLEFLDDPEVFGRTDEKGFLRLGAPEVLDELERQDKRDLTRVEVFPLWLYRNWERDGSLGMWRIGSRVMPREAEGPIHGISKYAAMEYASWRTRWEANGFRYRLPGALEWERAARGEDRRLFVWGNFMVWCFSWSLEGAFPMAGAPVAGAFPIDESIFGVRDMAGSVEELTDDQPLPKYRNNAFRGGSYLDVDPNFFHIASRNTVLPERPNESRTGVRLVAELKERR